MGRDLHSLTGKAGEDFHVSEGGSRDAHIAWGVVCVAGIRARGDRMVAGRDSRGSLVGGSGGRAACSYAATGAEGA